MGGQFAKATTSCQQRHRQSLEFTSAAPMLNGRCPKGHILETFSMPKEKTDNCKGCGKYMSDLGTLTRGCRRCDYDVCEIVSSTPSGCVSQCTFGTPMAATIRMQGPALSSKYSAEHVLSGKDVWFGPDHKASWFMLDLGSICNVGGFELRNATGGRSITEYTLEASQDSTSWRMLVRNTLNNCSDLIQVACDKRYSVMRYVRFAYQSFKGCGGGLQYFAVLNRQGEPPTAYAPSPRPPRHLWDLSDPQFLDLVRCHAVVRVTDIDSKAGTFALSMKCNWAFRTLKERQGAELLLRGVPGIRMPSLAADVVESRFWKVLHEDKSSSKTVYWEGTSTITLKGFKMFHMERFPFDRQIINLEQFYFVWRADKSDADFYKPMKVVSFTMETISVLSEWITAPAYIIPIAKYTTTPDDESDPSYSSSFVVKLRLEHQHGFYIWQIFFPALIMTLTSITPLAMLPQVDDMGDRLSVYGGGLLTLTVFKFMIAEHLPSVPYATFTDVYLRWQLVTVGAAMFVSVLSLHIVLNGEAEDGHFLQSENWLTLDNLENTLFFLLCAVWTVYALYAYLYMPGAKSDWRDVWAQKQNYNRDLPYFETCTSNDDGTEDYRSISFGVKLITARDNIKVWDLQPGEPVGELTVGQVVEAAGAAVSSEQYGKRFDPEGDHLSSKQGLLQRYAGRRPPDELEKFVEKHWQDECEPRMMVPIRNCGAVAWQDLRLQDADDPITEVYHHDQCYRKVVSM